MGEGGGVGVSTLQLCKFHRYSISKNYFVSPCAQKRVMLARTLITSLRGSGGGCL